MQKQFIAYALVAIVALPFVMQSPAFAQQYGQAATNSPTLEENLKLARERIAAVQANPHAGSGTPFLDAGGLITGMVVVAVIFGVLFSIFVWQGKKAEEIRQRR